MTPVQVAWERTLAAEGLAPLDPAATAPARQRAFLRTVTGAHYKLNGQCMVSRRGARIPTDIEEGAVATDRYLVWARGVLATFHFRTHGQRSIWGLLAEGRTYTDIQQALAVSRQDIARTVADVDLMAPGPKPRNPWRKDGRKEATMAKQQAAQLGQPVQDPQNAENAAWPRHLPRWEQPVQPAPRPKFTYTRILMRRGLTFKIPGISVEKDTLRDIEGRPHVGGIDVVCTVEDFPGLKDGVPVVITLPWWKIDQADRALEV